MIQCLPSGPSGDRGENFEVGVEHILDRCNAHTAYNTQEVPFPAIWRVCKAKNFLARSAPGDGGAPLRYSCWRSAPPPNVLSVPRRLVLRVNL